MKSIQVKFKRLVPEAQIPKKANPSDSGFDLTAVSDPEVSDDGYIQYHTGIVLELPEGYEGQIRCRSSISKYHLILANCLGTIDSGFRGEILVRFRPVQNFFDQGIAQDFYAGKPPDYKLYKKGDRIAQLVILPLPQIELMEAESLSETARGAGGFGSTGR